MTSIEFIRALSLKTGVPQKKTLETVELLCKLMENKLKEGESVTIMNFGSFEVRQSAQRTINNPKTKHQMIVPQKKKLIFYPVELLKQLI
ncbi:MAG: HU family DNA-binding protein, partial [Prevotellaceae bacterium]|nr:HU family DNA-binding protein [Prevotellaceae bacterium]